MGLSTYISVKLERADYKFIDLLAQIIKSPIIVSEEGKDPISRKWDMPYPKDDETINLYLDTLLSVNNYMVSVKHHVLTEEEKKDNYAAGLDITIHDAIKAPYKGHEDAFSPLITLCKLYGFSSYTITSDYTDEVITEEFKESVSFPTARDAGRGVANQFSAYIAQNAESLVLVNWEELKDKADILFDAYIKDRTERMRGKDRLVPFSENEIKYNRYDYVSYDQYMAFYAWEVFKNAVDDDPRAFKKEMLKMAGADKSYIDRICDKVTKYSSELEEEEDLEKE